jgi:hypothetical protein
VLATAQFTRQGVRIAIDNRTGEPLDAPLVAWNGRYYRLPLAAPGQTSHMLGAKNPAGDFTNVGGVITSEEATLRGQIVDAAQPSLTGQGPQLLGWLDPSSTSFGASVLRVSTTPQPLRSQVMLRAPVRVTASAPGETIAIPPDFVTFTGGADAGVFYDAERREWLQSIQTGTWALGFRAPIGIGNVRPLRATIGADLTAPAHTITLRRGQCRDGVLADNPDGPVVAEWNDVSGTRTATVDLDAADVDADGNLWLRMAVEVTSFAGGGAIPQWKFNDLSVGLDVRVEDGAERQP